MRELADIRKSLPQNLANIKLAGINFLFTADFSRYIKK